MSNPEWSQQHRIGLRCAVLQVMDNWQGQPGAAVIAPGGTASKERRLLDWANDMEAIVNTQVCEPRPAVASWVAHLCITTLHEHVSNCRLLLC